MYIYKKKLRFDVYSLQTFKKVLVLNVKKM
nr:MAG TPA: hypothetical protein [Caudoviricetes sp.]